MKLSKETIKMRHKYIDLTGKRPRPLYIDIFESEKEYQEYLRKEIKRLESSKKNITLEDAMNRLIFEMKKRNYTLDMAKGIVGIISSQNDSVEENIEKMAEYLNKDVTYDDAIIYASKIARYDLSEYEVED